MLRAAASRRDGDNDIFSNLLISITDASQGGSKMVVPSQTSSMDSTEQADEEKTHLRSEHFKQRPNNMVLCKLCKLEMALSLQYYRHAPALEALERGNSTAVILGTGSKTAP